MCETCVARDGHASEDFSPAAQQNGWRKGMDWADFPSDNEVTA
jgi:hypothetical protein